MNNQNVLEIVFWYTFSDLSLIEDIRIPGDRSN